MEVGRKNKYFAKKYALFCVIPNYLLILRTSTCVNYGESAIPILSVEHPRPPFLGVGCDSRFIFRYRYIRTEDGR
jgi:hypothetical protein